MTKTARLIASGEASEGTTVPLSKFDGTAVGAAFIARVASGQATDGELWGVFRECKDETEGAAFLQVVQAQLVTCLDPNRVAVETGLTGPIASRLSPELVEQVIRDYWALAQKLALYGSVTVVQKKKPAEKRIDLLKDETGKVTGAVMTTD